MGTSLPDKFSQNAKLCTVTDCKQISSNTSGVNRTPQPAYTIFQTPQTFTIFETEFYIRKTNMTEDKVPFPAMARNFKHKTLTEKRIPPHGNVYNPIAINIIK